MVLVCVCVCVILLSAPGAQPLFWPRFRLRLCCSGRGTCLRGRGFLLKKASFGMLVHYRHHPGGTNHFNFRQTPDGLVGDLFWKGPMHFLHLHGREHAHPLIENGTEQFH